MYIPDTISKIPPTKDSVCLYSCNKIEKEWLSKETTMYMASHTTTPKPMYMPVLYPFARLFLINEKKTVPNIKLMLMPVKDPCQTQ